jgi:hypothetical protein
LRPYFYVFFCKEGLSARGLFREPFSIAPQNLKKELDKNENA